MIPIAASKFVQNLCKNKKNIKNTIRKTSQGAIAVFQLLFSQIYLIKTFPSTTPKKKLLQFKPDK
jgi:hypothetical protein